MHRFKRPNKLFAWGYRELQKAFLPYYNNKNQKNCKFMIFIEPIRKLET